MILDKKVKSKVIKYWVESAEHDYETMLVLYNNLRYSDTLFFGHIILEKILKALYVKINSEHAPYTHDLLDLSYDLKLKQEDRLFLERVNSFNIRARYPDSKLEFYRKANKTFTEKNILKIQILYKTLCEQLKQY